MRCFILCLLALLTSCVTAPRVTATVVPFSTPPFTFQFVVNQPGNSIDIRFPGITNITYIPGTSAYISNQQAYLGTNNFSGGGGGGGSGTLTNGVYTNAGPDTVVVSGSGTLALNTNKFAAPVDSRAWTNLNNGVSKFNGTVQMGKLTSDGGGVHSDGSGGLQVGSLTSLGTLAAGAGGFVVDSSGNATGLSFTGVGSGLTTLNASALSSGTAPTARLGSGTANGLTFLRGDSSWFGVVTNLIYTNAGPDVLLRDDIAFLNTNNIGGGSGGGLNQLTGDVLAGPGTGSQVATLKNTGTAGTYRSTTFDAQGRETSGSNPTTFAGYAISDTWPNLAAALTLLIPQAALGTGSGGTGTKFLADDQTYKTVSGGSGGGGFSNQLNGVIVPGYMKFYTSGAIGLNPSLMDALADLDNRGHLDLVIVESAANNRFLYQTNIGWGNFASQTVVAMTATSCYFVVPSDVNKDGTNDLIFMTSAGVEVMTNNGNAAFHDRGSVYGVNSTAVRSIAVADFDTNGYPDIAVPPSTGVQGIIVLTNDKTGIFNYAYTNPIITYNASASTPGIASADFDTNGLPDLIALTLATSVPAFEVFTNPGGLSPMVLAYSNIIAGSVSTAGGSLAVGDFNNDGRPDFVFVDSSVAEKAYFYTNSGGGVFGPYSTNQAFSSVSISPPVFISVPGHVYPDAYFVDNGNIVCLTNNGQAFFPAWTNIYAAGSGKYAALGDVTGDGVQDIMIAGTTTPSLMVGSSKIYGIYSGDGGALSNTFTLAFTSSQTSTMGVGGTNDAGAVTKPPVLTLTTNYVPYVATFAPVSVIGNGLGVTNISFCTTSASTSGTVTSANTHQIETTYMSSGSTIVSLTWALPTSTTLGKIFYLHSKSAITTLTITGGSFIDTAVVAMTAGQTIGFETIDGAGTYIRMQ